MIILVFLLVSLLCFLGAIWSIIEFGLADKTKWRLLFNRHIITFSTSLQPSSLVWDPIAQHFVVGSIGSPTIHAISNDGMVEHLLSEPSLARSNASATFIAVDHIRRRLIVVFSNPSSIAAYDLKSYERIYIVPLPETNTTPGGVAVDLRSGEAFVSSTKRGVVWKVGQKGAVRVLSKSQIFGNQGLGGVVHVSDGYLLVVQPTTRKIFKVDSDNGAAKEVPSTTRFKLLVPGSHAIALHLNLSVVVAASRTLHLVKSDDNWSKAHACERSEVEEEATIVAVALQEGESVYALIKLQEGYRIEEVRWHFHQLGIDFLMFSGGFCIGLFFMGFFAV